MKNLKIIFAMLVVLPGLALAQTPGTTTVLTSPTAVTRATNLYISVGEEASCFTTDVDSDGNIELVRAATFDIIDLNFKTEISNTKFIDGCEYQISEIKISDTRHPLNTVSVKLVDGVKLQAEQSFVVECQAFSEGIDCGSLSKLLDIR